LTGAVTADGRGSATAPQPPSGSPSATCADIATAADGGNLGDHVEPVAGHHIAWDTSIGALHGPGDYSDGQALQLTVDSDTYVAEDHARVDIAIDPRFGTTISFHDLQSTGDLPSSLSGSIPWTRADPVAT
jgi:hypothetical protein